MAKGDLPVSPWSCEFLDYQSRRIEIVVVYDNATRALQTATISRDSGCVYRNVVLDNPNDVQLAKVLPCPADGQGPRTYTALQMMLQGLRVIEDIWAVQITCT